LESHEGITSSGVAAAKKYFNEYFSAVLTGVKLFSSKCADNVAVNDLALVGFTGYYCMRV
jgi:hypothetical protein